MSWKKLFCLFTCVILPLHADYQEDIIESPENGFFGWELYKEEPEAGEGSKFLLVTGCFASGNPYTYVLLSKTGLKELGLKPGRDWAVSWVREINDKRVGLRRTYKKGVSYQHIFHQVRDPLKVISSISKSYFNTNSRIWKIIRSKISEISPDDSLIVQSAKCWYYFNKRAEARAEYRYRVEDFESAIPQFKKRLGAVINEEVYQTTFDRFHHRDDETEAITWKELRKELPPLLYKDIEKMAKRYGYHTKD